MKANRPVQKEAQRLHTALGAYVLYLRKSQHPKEWSQSYFAKRAGVSQGLVSGVEDGKSVRLTTYIRLAHVFGISFEDLVRRAMKYSKRKEAK